MNRKKIIMFGGVPRAGKTTLAVKLVKSGKGFSKISGDYLNGAVRDTNTNKFEYFKFILEGIIREAEVYGINSIFDYCSYDFSLEDIEKLPFKDKLDMYFFGFPDISPEEIKYNICHYAEPTDWIYNVDDNRREFASKRIYGFNIKLKEWCKQHNYRFVNTGVGEERNIALNSLYDEIIEKWG